MARSTADHSIGRRALESVLGAALVVPALISLFAFLPVHSAAGAVPSGSLLASLTNHLPLHQMMAWLLWFGTVILWIWVLDHRPGLRRPAFTIIVPSLMAAIFFASRDFPPMGDASFLAQAWHRHDRTIGASEPIAALLLTQFLDPGVLSLFLPPLMGFLSSVLFFLLPVRSLSWERYRLRLLLWTAVPVQMVFYRGYAETMLFGIPAGLLFLHGAVRISHVRSIVSQGALAAFAALVHGVHLALLPVVPLMLLFRQRDPLRPVLRGAIFLLWVLVLYGAGLGLLHTAGYRLDWMNASGGVDHRSMVPLSDIPGSVYVAYTFGSLAHLAAVGTVLLLAGPLLPAALIILRQRIARSIVACRIRTDQLAFGLAFGAFFAFVSLWNFDLGFYWDFDLILSLSLASPLLFESILPRRAVDGGERVLLRIVSGYGPFLVLIQTCLWMLAWSRFFH